MSEDFIYSEQVAVALDQLFKEFVKILKKEKVKVSARATQFVKNYKKLCDDPEHHDLEQRANLVKLMAQLAVEKTGGKQRLTLTLANEVKSLYDKVKKLRSDWQQVVKVEEAFQKLDTQVCKNGQTISETTWVSPEYKALIETVLEKPGQVAKLFIAMTARLDRFMPEIDINPYFRQVKLFYGVFSPLRGNNGLSILAKAKLRRLLKALAKHVNDRLKLLPLDEQKQQLLGLEPALLALILSESTLELQRLFEKAIEESETLLETLSSDDLSKIESKLKAKDHKQDPDLLKALSDVSDLLEPDLEELLLIVDAFTHALAGNKQIKITKEEQQKIWRILQVITVLAAKMPKDQKGTKEWRSQTILILNKIVEVLRAYPEVIIKDVVRKLPKTVQLYVLSKLSKDNKIAKPQTSDDQQGSSRPTQKRLIVLPIKKTDPGALI